MRVSFDDRKGTVLEQKKNDYRVKPDDKENIEYWKKESCQEIHRHKFFIEIETTEELDQVKTKLNCKVISLLKILGRQATEIIELINKDQIHEAKVILNILSELWHDSNFGYMIDHLKLKMEDQ